VNLRRSTNDVKLEFHHPLVTVGERTVLNEEAFHRMISVERKRTERSGKPFLLMLLDTGSTRSDRNGALLAKIIFALSVSTRETDGTGWYEKNAVVGVLFTEIAVEDRNSILSRILSRISGTLQATLTLEQFNQISISFHLFPEQWNIETEERPSNPKLYPDLQTRENGRKHFKAIKRVMDIIGGMLALTIFGPVFLGIAVAVKVSSKGPVFFKQTRIGQLGVPFVFLKFRSMYVNNDASVHKEYVRQLIAGKAELKPSNGNGNGNGVYKLTNDSRITRVGAFIRRTSLDELPQFLNVLKGEMSLVGPRPAIPYEVEAYNTWHRRRVLEAKPGITGLWQINGRSRVEFDDRVRLDLRYARAWSPWMDLGILVRTPAAVIMGEGAH
jgi:lipopolysaccharide/colanic/teichoic acid biosynthesis glycosyltransferase